MNNIKFVNSFIVKFYHVHKDSLNFTYMFSTYYLEI